MENSSDILLKILPPGAKSSTPKKYAETVNMYQKCSELIEKTYRALGKRNKFNYLPQSSSDGKIDTSAVSATSQI